MGLDPDFGRCLPGMLSGGQCRRAGIARALSVSPELLICNVETPLFELLKIETFGLFHRNSGEMFAKRFCEHSCSGFPDLAVIIIDFYPLKTRRWRFAFKDKSA